MQIIKNFKDSGAYKIFEWLFVDKKTICASNSVILNILQRFSNQKIAIIAFVLSLVFYWYEAFFSSIEVLWIEQYNFGLIFLILALFFCDKSRIRLTKSVIYLLSFVVAMLISGLMAAIGGIERGMIVSGMMIFLQFILSFMIASTFLYKKTFIDSILIISVPLVIVGVWQGTFGESTSKLWVSGAENLINARSFGFFGSPNVFAGVLMILIIMAIFSFFNEKRWIYLIYSFIALISLVLTFSRSAWIGLSIGVLAALVIKNWRYICFCLIGLIGLIVPSIRQRIFVAFSPEYIIDSGLDGRIWSLNNAIEIFKTTLITGSGPGTYGGQTAIYYNSPIYLKSMQNGYVALLYSDNQWTQLLVQTGMLGIFTFSGFVISLLVNNVRQFIKNRKNHIPLGVVAELIAFVIFGIFGNVLEFGAVSVLAGGYMGLGNSYEK